MKKLFFILVSVALGLSVAQPLSAQEGEKEQVVCILLDNTLSMIGKGGENIWADVQEYCYSLVDGIKVPSTVVFYTYAQNLSSPKVIKVNSASDRAKVKDAIRNVVVDGRHTWIASNFAKAWNDVRENYPNAARRIYLITDGKEEQMGSSIQKVAKDYSATKMDYDHAYYVDLNGALSDGDVDSLDDSGFKVVTGMEKELFTVTTKFATMDYTLGKTQSLSQLIVEDGQDVSELSFVAEAYSEDANVTISPKTVMFKDLKKDGDTYTYEFKLTFHNASAKAGKVKVTLTGVSAADSELTFVPSTFVVDVKEKVNPYVNPTKGGWKLKL